MPWQNSRGMPACNTHIPQERLRITLFTVQSPCRLKTIDSWRAGRSLLEFSMLLSETGTHRAPDFSAAALELQGPVERGRSLWRFVSGDLYIFETGTTVKWYVTSRTKPAGGFSA
jgi:hypothetical protein